jgi:hypothetical protein
MINHSGHSLANKFKTKAILVELAKTKFLIHEFFHLVIFHLNKLFSFIEFNSLSIPNEHSINCGLI